MTRDGNRGVLFDTTSDRVDDRAFAARCEDDRHHFRFIVSPEEAADLEDLKAFTRDLAGQIETDLETKLDWIAVDHWNTDNPHIHLIVRGVDETGADLVISRDYISQGLRSRGEELVSLELGPKSEQDIRGKLEKDISAERWTSLDREIRIATDDVGAIDLRPATSDKSDRAIRRLIIGRLRYLEKLGLATKTSSGEWVIALEMESRLRDLGMRLALLVVQLRLPARCCTVDQTSWTFRVETQDPIPDHLKRHGRLHHHAHAVECQGQYLAAACLVVVAEKALRDPEQITCPGGYFRAMIDRAGPGKVRLHKSFHGLV